MPDASDHPSSRAEMPEARRERTRASRPCRPQPGRGFDNAPGPSNENRRRSRSPQRRQDLYPQIYRPNYRSRSPRNRYRQRQRSRGPERRPRTPPWRRRGLHTQAHRLERRLGENTPQPPRGARPYRNRQSEQRSTRRRPAEFTVEPADHWLSGCVRFETGQATLRYAARMAAAISPTGLVWYDFYPVLRMNSQVQTRMGLDNPGEQVARDATADAP